MDENGGKDPLGKMFGGEAAKILRRVERERRERDEAYIKLGVAALTNVVMLFVGTRSFTRNWNRFVVRFGPDPISNREGFAILKMFSWVAYFAAGGWYSMKNTSDAARAAQERLEEAKTPADPSKLARALADVVTEGMRKQR